VPSARGSIGLRRDKKRFDAELQQAPPGASDAQASLVSSATGWSSETSGSVLSVVTAIVLEFAAAGGAGVFLTKSETVRDLWWANPVGHVLIGIGVFFALCLVFFKRW
jgi:hypothetical protein